MNKRDETSRKVWKNPKEELPNEGEQVWMLYKHWKENGIMGFQMMGGEVEYIDPIKKIGGRANSCDYTGSGLWCVYFDKTWESEEHGTLHHDDVAIAWAYPQDLPLPEWNKIND